MSTSSAARHRKQVRRLDVAVEQAGIVRLGERAARLRRAVGSRAPRAARRSARRATRGRARRAAPSRSRRCRRRDAVVEDLRSCGASASRRASGPRAGTARASRRSSLGSCSASGADQLDRRGSREQPVLGAPHLAHAAGAEPARPGGSCRARGPALRPTAPLRATPRPAGACARGSTRARARARPRSRARPPLAMMLERSSRRVGAEQRARRDERRDVPVERDRDAGALAADRRDRGEVRRRGASRSN